MESQKSDLFVFINMSSKTHQALFIFRLSGSGFKVQGLRQHSNLKGVKKRLVTLISSPNG